MKIRPVGAGWFHAGGQTDRHDGANIWFPQFLRTRLKILNFAHRAHLCAVMVLRANSVYFPLQHLSYFYGLG